MAIQYRSTGTSGNSDGNGSTSVKITLPTGFAAGDLLFVVLRTGNNSLQTFSQTSGTGTWTIDFQGQATGNNFNYMVAHRVMASGDTNPTFSWQASFDYSWSCGGFLSSLGVALTVDTYAGGDPVMNSSSANSITPNPATVSSGTEASIILTTANASSASSTGSHTYTPPSGWTFNDGDDAYYDGASRKAKFAAHAYQLGVTGTVTPGSQSLTDGAGHKFFFAVFHALVHEAASQPISMTGSVALRRMNFAGTGYVTGTGSIRMKRPSFAGSVTVVPHPFPQVPVNLTAQINPSGVLWQDITSLVYQRQPPAVVITRGRPDGAQTPQPATATFQLQNTDNRFSPRNPLGVYYPNFQRNTPIRFSVPDPSTYLRIEDDNVSYATTSTDANITGNLELQIDTQLNNYTATILASEWNTSGNQKSWALVLNSNGTLQLYWSPDGSTVVSATSTMIIPLGRIAFRVTLTVSSGTVVFYTAPNISGTWTQLGASVVVGATSIFASSAPLIVGFQVDDLPNNGYNSIQGRVYAFKALQGISGSPTASPDFTSAAAGSTTMTDAQGNVWTVIGTAEFSNRNYRFHGQLSDVPQNWDPTGRDVWVPASAAGILRRLGQANIQVASAIERAWLAQTGGFIPQAYWPCEDGSQATSIGPLISTQPMVVSGSPQFASDTSFLCSNPIITVNGSIWKGAVLPYTPTNTVVVRFLLHITAGSEPPDSTVLLEAKISGGGIGDLQVIYRTGGNLQLKTHNFSNSIVADTGSQAYGASGTFLMVSAEVQPNATGTNTVTSLSVLPVGATAPTALGTVTGSLISVGNVNQVIINPAVQATGTWAVGHIAVQANFESVSVFANPLKAWLGETAANRFARLCNENNVPWRVYGIPSYSVAMGAQTIQTVLQLLQEVEDADQGMIYDSATAVAIGYRTLASLCDQTAALALDYSQGHFGQSQDDPGILPLDDDQLTRNDVVITRVNGGVIQAQLNDGSPMSIGSIGDYQYSANISLAGDAQLADIAGWYLHLGTVNESRYPAVPLNMARAALSSFQNAIIALNLGDYMSGANFPAWVTPDLVKMIIWGYTESIGGFLWFYSFITRPESPYETLVAGTGAVTDMRADTDGATVHANITSGATSMQVDTTNPNSPLWTTVAGDFPFDIIVAGERMTVTNITGAASPQTFTVTRAVNGIVKAHLAGESVSLFTPVYAALV